MFKVAITGPESTGKSTLAEKLAHHYKTDFVPEYSRTYLENFEGRYTEDDVVEIAKGQHNLILEEEKKKMAVKNEEPQESLEELDEFFKGNTK